MIFVYHIHFTKKYPLNNVRGSMIFVYHMIFVSYEHSKLYVIWCISQKNIYSTLYEFKYLK
jgi:hypothetical protein